MGRKNGRAMTPVTLAARDSLKLAGVQSLPWQKGYRVKGTTKRAERACVAEDGGRGDSAVRALRGFGGARPHDQPTTNPWRPGAHNDRNTPLYLSAEQLVFSAAASHLQKSLRTPNSVNAW